MAIDIGADILIKIREEFDGIFNSKSANGDYIQKILKKVEDGTATMQDVSTFSKGIGTKLSELLKKHLSAENLPDGTLYYNIADTVLGGTLHDNYELINSVAGQVQKELDKPLGINIKPQKAKFPAERVHLIINAVCDKTANADTIERRLTSPVENVTESFYNDYVEENAKFRSDAGLKVYIIRDDHNGCCEWCSKLAGKYEYPDKVPKDVYRRHDNCGCTTTFDNSKGKFQNVWSKKSWTPSAEEKERMKNIKANATKYTPQQARAKEKEIKQKIADRTAKNMISENDYHTKAELVKMPLSKLREETTEMAKKYYASGKSGISFGGANTDEVAKNLTANASRNSLTKDYMALKKHLIDIDKSGKSGIIDLVKETGIKGVPNIPPKKIDVKGLKINSDHISERNHNVTFDDAISFIEKADISLTKWQGEYENYYSTSGATFVNTISKEIETSFTADEFDDKAKKMMEVIEQWKKK